MKGVRDVDPTIKIVMQHGRPRPDGDFMDWYNGIKDRIDFDYIGGSTYGTTNNGNIKLSNVNLENGIYVIKATVGSETAVQRVRIFDKKLKVKMFNHSGRE